MKLPTFSSLLAWLRLVESTETVLWCPDGTALALSTDAIEHRLLSGRIARWEVEHPSDISPLWAIRTRTEDPEASKVEESVLARLPSRRAARKQLLILAERLSGQKRSGFPWLFWAVILFSGWMVWSSVRSESPVSAPRAAVAATPPISIPAISSAPLVTPSSPEIEMLPECDSLPSDLDSEPAAAP